MYEKTCCITSHRDIPHNEVVIVKEKLCIEVEKAVSDGFTCFLCGFSEGIDQYFAELILAMRQKNSALSLIAVIPYRKRLETLKERPYTYELLESCSDVIIMQEEYHPSVYSHRNRYMAEHSDRIIAVYDGREQGGTVRTIRFAHQMNKELREIPVGEIAIPQYLK